MLVTASTLSQCPDIWDRCTTLYNLATHALYPKYQDTLPTDYFHITWKKMI